MIPPNYTFNIVQSWIGQLSSDHNNIIESLTSSPRMESLSISDNNTNCSSIIIGLIMGLLIIFIKNLHTPSTWNIIIIIITILILFTGFIVLVFSLKQYYSRISDIVASVTTNVAMILGLILNVLSVKWRKILFGFACLFTLTGIIFTIVGCVFKEIRITRVSLIVNYHCVLFSKCSPVLYGVVSCL
ncbi:hypothetical protein KSF78_0007853 [Schistosoma japonicum]|nr:hypothetical protein KSF78_0007853 [Schistosoma japonicum]